MTRAATDLRLRTAGRALAADSSPEARAAWIRERLRAGLDPERVELAAYCSDPAALTALPPCERFSEACEPHLECDCCGCHDGVPLAGAEAKPPDYERCVRAGRLYSLTVWLRGLSRWEGAQVRAAMAAARMALEVAAERAKFDGRPIERIHAELRAAGRAIEAAEAWAACPCEEHLQAWRTACSLVAMGRFPWLPHALAADSPERAESLRASIVIAAGVAGEPAVREAIQRALVEWALGGGA